MAKKNTTKSTPNTKQAKNVSSTRTRTVDAEKVEKAVGKKVAARKGVQINVTLPATVTHDGAKYESARLIEASTLIRRAKNEKNPELRKQANEVLKGMNMPFKTFVEVVRETGICKRREAKVEGKATPAKAKAVVPKASKKGKAAHIAAAANA